MKPAIVATALSGVIPAAWLVSEAMPVRLKGEPAVPAPRLVLPCRERDFGTLSQGIVLRAAFRVKNAGTRRLILVDETDACCGQSPGPRSVTVAPGESKDLTVEVDTAQWYGRMVHTVCYTTNDPGMPRFNVTVMAHIESPPSPAMPGCHGGRSSQQPELNST